MKSGCVVRTSQPTWAGHTGGLRPERARRNVQAPSVHLGVGMMLRRALVFSAAVWGFVLPTPALANSHTGQTTFVFSERGGYACTGDCATATEFTAWGTALSPGSGLGQVRFSLAGTVLDINADGTCLLQSETWVVTARGGKDALLATTTSDNFCFGTTDPNANHEFGHWEGVGTAGNWLGDHFSADFDETVLGSPQVASGTVVVTIG